MFKVTHFNRNTMATIDHAILKALADVESAYGLKIKINGGSYTDTSYSPKIEIRTVDASGNVAIDPMFKMMCDRFGLDPSITSRDGYKITGYKGSRPKFPWNIEDRSGVSRKATQGWVLARFKGTPLVPGVLKPAPSPTASVITISDTTMHQAPPEPDHQYDGRF